MDAGQFGGRDSSAGGRPKKVAGERDKGRRSRDVMTAVGRIRLTRMYVTDRDGGRFPGDDVVGVDGYLSVGAQQMATLAGLQQSFARAEQLLHVLSGWELDDETIRRLTHSSATAAAQQRSERKDVERFATAAGVLEVPIDAGKVNTLDGWRDVKMAVFSKREMGSPATPTDYAERKLPKPTIRTVIADIVEVEKFSERVRQEADRLHVTTAPDITVLADGAEWIWNLADDVFPQAAGVLDFYHAVEHIATATKAIWGEGTPTAIAQLDAGRTALVSNGKVGWERWLAEAMTHVPAGVSTDPLLHLAAYLAKHPTRLNYASRLAAGRTIGSGQVEGAIKQLVNLRLKRTGARWRADHVGPLVELIALSSTPQWNQHWTAM